MCTDNYEDYPNGSLLTSCWFWSVCIVSHRSKWTESCVASSCCVFFCSQNAISFFFSVSLLTGEHTTEKKQGHLCGNRLSSTETHWKLWFWGPFFFFEGFTFSYTQVRGHWLTEKSEWIWHARWLWISFINQLFQINQILWIDPMGIYCQSCKNVCLWTQYRIAESWLIWDKSKPCIPWRNASCPPFLHTTALN